MNLIKALPGSLLIMLLACQPTLANTQDRYEAISVKADNSVYDEKAGTQELSGNVEITQGSMSITADNIKIELRDGKLYRISGLGKPIRFQQRDDSNQIMRGQSNRIAYDVDTSEITFEGDALFEKPGQKLSGHTIRYNMQNLTFKAAGTDQSGSKGRVNIVLQPARKANDN